MSLISDALRAAQDARSASAVTAARAAAARRILTPPVRPRTDRGAGQVAGRLGRALAVFTIAVVVAAAVVLSSPDVDRMADRAVPPAARLAVNPLLSQTRGDGANAAVSTDVSASGHPGESTEAAPGTDVGSGHEAPPRADAAPRETGALRAAAGGAASSSGSRASTRSGTARAAPSAAPSAASAAARPETSVAPRVSEGAPGFELRLDATARESGRLFEEARAAHARRDYPAAAALYERALQQDPNNAEILNNLGTVRQAAGDLLGASEAFRRAIDIDPRYAGAWSNLGVALAALGEAARARAALVEAIRLEPGNAAASVNLALEYQKQGLNGEALRLLREVVAGFPEMPEAHYALARLLEGEGDRSGAVRHYRRFISTGAEKFPSLIPPVRQRVAELGG